MGKKLDLPVIIHSRGECDKDIIEILKRVGTPRRGGVIHCFSEDWKLAQEYLSMRLYLSIAGNVTFDDRKHIQKVVRNMDLRKLLVETDSPYVAPNLYKGKRNNPTNIIHTIEKIAEIKGKTFEEISEITYYNTKKLFKIS